MTSLLKHGVIRDYDLERAGEVRRTLEDLVDGSKIRHYGRSTDDLERARLSPGVATARPLGTD